MEKIGGINNILPEDKELEKRDKIFLNLFNKYSIDEGSDPELMEDSDLLSDEDDADDNNDSDLSSSVVSSSGSESSFDMENMKQQIIPVIKDRVLAWPEKGICLQLKTVDPSVTVAEWLQSNQEHTTTKRQTRKTIITEGNKTTIITTTKKTSTTTTTSKSFKYMRRGNAENDKEEVKEITNEDNDDDNALGRTSSTNRGKSALKNHKSRKQEKSKDQSSLILKKDTPSNVAIQSDVAVKSKRFYLPRLAKRNGVNSVSNGIIPPINFEPPEKIQKFLPEVKKTTILTDSTSMNNSNCDSQIVDNVFDETFGTSNSEQQKSSKELYPPKRSMKTSTNNNSVLKRKQILIHSPNSGNLLGTKIDDTFMLVTRKDIEKRIDSRLRIPDKSYMNESVVPINQKIVYEPPTSERMKNNSDSEDSESDDVLLTSYTRTGHFLRLN